MLAKEHARVNVCAEDKIEEYLCLPSSEGWCQHGGRPAHLRSITNPGRERVVRFACKSWECRVCVAWKRLRAGRHFGAMILKTEGALFSKRISAAEWPSKQRTLRNRGADWVRVGELVIWSEPCEDGAKAHTDTEGAVRLLGEALRAISAPPRKSGTRFRPVTSSHAWKLPKKERRYERLGWVRVVNPVAVVEKLKGLGIERATIKTRRGTGAKLWDVVFECEPSRREEVAAALAG